MTSFCLVFLAGVGIACSMAGWGWLMIKLLRIQERGRLGYYAALGLAFSTSVGGLLNLLHAITPNLIVGYLSAGLLLAVFAAASAARVVRAQAAATLTYCKGHRLVTIAMLAVVALALFKYAIAVSPGRFQPQDDYQGYFVFPLKMIQNGTLGPDPFSERRIQSSLGGKEFLDTFPLSLTGETRNLHLMDSGVAFVIFVLLLSEIMIRKRLPAVWVVLILLTCVLFTAPVSNITAVYTAALLIVVLFDGFAMPLPQPRLGHVVVLAMILASLVALKTTFVPVAALAWLGYVLLTAAGPAGRRKAFANGVLCACLVGLLLLPWMVDSYRSSGTVFYPFFGRGFHGSRYGIYLLPTAQLGLRNVLAFFHGAQDVLFAVLALQIGLLLAARQWRDAAGRINVIIGGIVVTSVALIAGATGAYQVFRYTFPVVFAGVIYLLIQEMAAAKSRRDEDRSVFNSETVCVLLAGLLLGGAAQGFTYVEEDRISDLKFAISGRDINNSSEIASYRAMQLSVPAGQKMLVFLDKHYLLDFRRNPIYINDTPGGASLPPGMPAFKGPEPLADYLLAVGVRYLAYSYADNANFTRAEFGSRLDPEVNVNLRVGAKMAFDFEDNISLLGETRRRIFDNGKIFVLDLATKIPKPVTVSMISMPVDRPTSPQILLETAGHFFRCKVSIAILKGIG